MTTPPGKFAFEAIAYQSTEFFEAVTQATGALRQAMRETNRQAWQCELQSQTLEAVVAKYTNIKVKVCKDLYGPVVGICCPPMRNGHIFHHMEGWDSAASDAKHLIPKDIRKAREGFGRGKVDMRRNRVDGFFAQIPFELYLAQMVLGSEVFTDGEIAAAIMHEVGHAFTSMEYINRTVTTNQVLASICEALTGDAKTKAHEDQLETIVLQYAREEQLNNDQRLALEKCRTPEQFVVCAYAVADEQCRSELGHSVYESTSSEQLADQYATRCGAGRDLVSMLHKYVQQYGAYDKARRKLRLAGGIFSYLVVVGWIVAVYGVALGPVVGLVLGLAVGTFKTWVDVSMAKFGQRYAVYDEDPYRYERIRHQLIEQLKTMGRANQLDQGILQQIDEIEHLVQELKKFDVANRADHFSHHVAMFFSSVYRKRVDMENLQKELEAFASNNLFVHAAKLAA